MADLEGAATEAQEKVKALTAEVEKAQQRFDSLGEQIEAVQTKVSGAWSKLTEQVKTFIEKVGSERERLATESQEATQALGTLEGAVEQARGEAHSEAEDTTQQIAGFGEDVEGTEPDIAGMADQVQASAQSLSEQGDDVAKKLEEALGDAKEFLEGQVVSDLQSLQEEIRSRGDALKAAFEECAGELEESYDEWVDGLAEVERTVEEAFQEVDQNLATNVEDSVNTYSDEYMSALGVVVERVGEVERLLQQLEGTTAKCDEEAMEAEAELTQDLQTTQQGVEAARGKLEEIKALLASYAFVQ